MFVSLGIIGFSLVLFLYWFRYTCLLILSTKTARDYTAQVARANQLEFPAVRSSLQEDIALAGLEIARVSLERDYRLLTGLLSHAANFQIGSVSVEQRMLMIDYQVMRGWYWVASKFSHASYAREALREMADIVSHFANEMGERSAAPARS